MASAEETKPSVILAVDDDSAIRRVLKLRLELRGHRVLLAESGPQALALLEGEGAARPDLVICDVMMSGMDGTELCRRLRAMGLDVPFLFLTLRGDSDDRVRGFEAGADDYMVKPFDPLVLEAKVSALLRRR